MSLNCEAAKDLLLEHVYGALEDGDDAAVRAHLDACADCRRALDVARGQRDVLAAAARTEAKGVTLRPPKPTLRLFTARRVAVAAAALIFAFAGGSLAWRGNQMRTAESQYPRIAVLAPTAVAPGQPAEFLVDVTTVSGAPLAATVRLDVYGPQQIRLASKTSPTGADGKARLVFDPGLGAAGEQLRVDVAASLPGGVERHASTLVVRDGTRFLARVATDKPLYRPGEPVRVRAVALERFRLTPGGAIAMTAEILDPRGAKVASERMDSTQGVAAWEWPIPAGAPGGEYTLTLSGGDPAFAQFPKTERKFVVRSYRVPRIKSDVELDKDSYGPGDSGVASVSIERVEGGVPTGAKCESIVTVDGKDVAQDVQSLPASGRLDVKFTLPKDIAEGRAHVSVVVKDGGNVETAAKTIPIALGRLDVTYFPEGGDLVAGLANRVYFQAKSPTGERADLVADVVDGAGRVVAEARVDDLGMGRFELTPQVGATYRLVAKKPDAIKLTGEFPAVAASGVVLRSLDDVTSAGAPIRMEIAATTSGRRMVAAFCRGTLVAQDTVDLEAGTPRVVELKATSDVGGVVRVTAFEGSVPRAERLVSLTPSRRIDVSVAPGKPKVSPGETVKVDVTTRDETGKPVAAVLGVSVVDEAVIQLANDQDTAGFPLHFLLGLEVEELERADVFASGEHAARAVDRLLGVQGWRRFAWKKPAEFLAQNVEKGARVAVADAVDTPQHADNLADARMMVDWTRRQADERIVGAGVTGALGVAMLVGLVVLVGGIVRRRTPQWLGGLVATAALVLAAIAVFEVRHPGVEDRAVAAGDVAFAPGGKAAIRAIGWGAAGAKFEEPEEERRIADFDDEAFIVDRNAIPELNFKLDGAIAADAPMPAPAADPAVGLIAILEADKLVGGAGGGAGKEIVNDVERARRIGEFRKRQAADGRLRLLSRVYAHRKQPSPDGARADFAEVLYWNPLLVTDAAGKATFDFDASDSVTTFSVGVDAHDARGALAAASSPIRCRIPFFLEPKMPVALSAGDKLDLPIVVANDTDEPMDVGVALSGDRSLLNWRTYETTPAVRVAAGARGRFLWRVEAAQGQGEAALTITGYGGKLSDKSVRKVFVQPRGFPIDVAKGGVLEKTDRCVVMLPADLDRSTLAGALRLYPSTLSSLEDGLDSMLQEPCGCFEQASSTNYPNVLVLNYMRETEHAPAAVVARAKDLLAHGYQRLTGYECGHHGYEWFGGDPGHEALTAYGLMEFTDMAKVHAVDPKMIERTRDWLLARRDGKGGFSRNARALDTFGGAPQEITDAYCTWAITEADATTDVSKEIAKLVERGLASDDAYLVALAARTASNRRLPEATQLLSRLASMQKPDGGLSGKTTSITSSSGINLDVETTALAVLAFVAEPSRLPNATQGVQFLVAQRKNGGSFGATQATILALRALVEHARASKRTSSDHDLTVAVNGVTVAKRHVSAGATGAIAFEKELLDALRPGENRVEFTTTGTETLPWALAVRYHATLPATDPDCAVDVTTKLAKDVVAEGGTVRLDVTIANKKADGVPMTLARIGLPAGLEAREDQLKELKKSGAVDFYETRPREVTLYFRGMAGKDVKRLALDLVADIPGEFEGPATSAYLYYGDDKKTWAAPLRVRIDAAR